MCIRDRYQRRVHGFGYEVIPTSLDCNENEGFGIIEHSKYISVFRTNPETPEVYSEMIGFLYSNVAKNMSVNSISEMRMGSKYYVRVIKTENKVTITGPGVSLYADLKPDVHYVPCFSCGCSSNRLQIRPLTDIDEGDSL
eukprot:TRINITY_DN6606_c0_g1_i1.p2 TRINITY_DN6606_c0_g1~~TRINITY_DN6606_c0_g1_i1.p2  ORF type:complete len:140 (+),score=20.56 TRINITY_DN6606_c0_g1_i1:182-601(+)